MSALVEKNLGLFGEATTRPSLSVTVRLILVGRLWLSRLRSHDVTDGSQLADIDGLLGWLLGSAAQLSLQPGGFGLDALSFLVADWRWWFWQVGLGSSRQVVFDALFDALSCFFGDFGLPGCYAELSR